MDFRSVLSHAELTGCTMAAIFMLFNEHMKRVLGERRAYIYPSVEVPWVAEG